MLNALGHIDLKTNISTLLIHLLDCGIYIALAIVCALEIETTNIYQSKNKYQKWDFRMAKSIL